MLNAWVCVYISVLYAWCTCVCVYVCACMHVCAYMYVSDILHDCMIICSFVAHTETVLHVQDRKLRNSLFSLKRILHVSCHMCSVVLCLMFCLLWCHLTSLFLKHWLVHIKNYFWLDTYSDCDIVHWYCVSHYILEYTICVYTSPSISVISRVLVVLDERQENGNISSCIL